MRALDCRCGGKLFFDSLSCQGCGAEVAYDPANGAMRVVENAAAAPCRQRGEPVCCNWLAATSEVADAAGAAGAEADGLCVACRLTRVIPDLGVAANGDRWARLEAAKRRLVYTLLQLGLPLRDWRAQPQGGLGFDFKEDRRSNPAVADEKVMTGHADGIITINLAEADPVELVRIRTRMDEQYRTLIGHMRHESGHYYWDLLVRDGPLLEPCRELFGDERRDYGEALQRHYADGPAPGWTDEFVSAYASAHPWEDWAESWAHYLHMIDTLETAEAFGMGAHRGEPSAGPDDVDAHIASWIRLSVILNELNRSMGHDDPYPFVLAPRVRDKLRFVHRVVTSQANAAEPQPT